VTLIILGAALTVVSVVLSYFLTDRSRWRKTVLVVGLFGAALSFAQGYRNLERADDLQNKLGVVECVQSQISGRHFTPEQSARLVSRLAAFPGIVANIWRFTGAPGTTVRMSSEKEKIKLGAALVDVFRAADWKNNGVTVRQFPFPESFQFITVKRRAASDTRIDMAEKALTEELATDCITAVVGDPFTDNGDFGQTVFVDNSGAHPDTSQATILINPPLQDADISLLIGEGL
jgi:hypothetical protein